MNTQIRTAVNNYRNIFTECEALKLPDNAAAGTRRGKKGSGTEQFIEECIGKVIANKGLFFGERKIAISDGYAITVDRSIVDDEDRLLAIFEVKDYVDTNMYSSFLYKCQNLFHSHPDLICFSIAMQQASTPEKTNSMMNISRFSAQEKLQINHYTIFPQIKRNSKNELWLLDVANKEVDTSVDDFISFLESCFV